LIDAIAHQQFAAGSVLLAGRFGAATAYDGQPITQLFY